MSTSAVSDLLLRTAKAVARGLDDALAAAGGSAATWQVLRAVRGTDARTQADLADVVGVRQPTLTHHLDGLERAGLVTRWRDPDNRRVQRVLLTAAGEDLFVRLRRAAAAFEGRLTAGLEDDDLGTLRRLLATLAENGAD
ncbi:MarR family winged helix-turn-helix transcriptional regulator [Blastococcus sp. TF02A-26]|uniref:MarR family winged helix-turn-helix transcriptional regulator n=1 Tax=Blastococcus sp. TF02A-26 TaxID=2250577 RepID=UPI000DE81FB4|nr:MarR family winged helix-turn-helix transcriptional regulator [Blastococcus sp. TF02A-26]RBY90524.1 MarR family transcriptional regulator [Blastococcus sp. TF02A-26]